MAQKKPSKTLQRAALKAQEDANRAQREALQSQENMRINFAQNLANENVASVIAGGTADELGIDSTETQRKRRLGGSGLASTLGIST